MARGGDGIGLDVECKDHALRPDKPREKKRVVSVPRGGINGSVARDEVFPEDLVGECDSAEHGGK